VAVRRPAPASGASACTLPRATTTKLLPRPFLRPKTLLRWRKFSPRPVCTVFQAARAYYIWTEHRARFRRSRSRFRFPRPNTNDVRLPISSSREIGRSPSSPVSSLLQTTPHDGASQVPLHFFAIKKRPPPPPRSCPVQAAALSRTSSLKAVWS